MNNVRTEQTPLWFHSTDSLINRNVWPVTESIREREERNGGREETGTNGMTQDERAQMERSEGEGKETGVRIALPYLLFNRSENILFLK